AFALWVTVYSVSSRPPSEGHCRRWSGDNRARRSRHERGGRPIRGVTNARLAPVTDTVRENGLQTCDLRCGERHAGVIRARGLEGLELTLEDVLGKRSAGIDPRRPLLGQGRGDG